MKKNISILGVTGSIGKSSLNICKNFPDNINIIAISANKNIKSLLSILDEFKPKYAVISDAGKMKEYFGAYEKNYNGIMIYSGYDYLNKICCDKSNDIIINGISGKAGLGPSIDILSSGIDLGLANKESIVCAGPILIKLSEKKNAKIIPVDSEHSAIFQLVRNQNIDEIQNIYLTASGGPFLNLDKNKWHKITKQDALKHPTWNMGDKITIDSATMANKGLEVIEAHFLFNLDYSKINVLIHPQSIIHSMVETLDREVYAQLGPKDMSLPIQNAIFYPKIAVNNYNKLDFTKSLKLELLPVDLKKFKMLQFAYDCGKTGGLYPCFYNFINETLVTHFLNKYISFLQIEEYTEKSIEIFENNTEFSSLKLTVDNIKKVELFSEEIIKDLLNIKKM